MIYLDTHAVVWLFSDKGVSFPEGARKLLENEEPVISPAVYLEIEFLYEVGKIRPHAEEIFDYLQRRISLAFSMAPFEQVVKKATLLRWTRDPFDRLIVGTAIVSDAVLITKDREILTNYPKAMWK